MPDSIITLTTDLGGESPYVAAMKGVILSVNPSARIIDLSHQIPPQDTRYAAFFLASALPYFPPDVLHVVVVDPGVGTERALLYVEVKSHRLLVPDNGCWSTLVSDASPRVVKLAEPRYWRQPVSSTFHGRDILAPVAAHLSLGLDARLLGPEVDNWQCLTFPSPQRESSRIHGEVLFVDHFGNLITNISADELPPPTVRMSVKVRNIEISHRVRSYAEAAPGDVVALISSVGMLEIAVNQGSAAQRLQAIVGTPVVVSQNG